MVSRTGQWHNQGWNLAAELDGSNDLLRTHIWGSDASGTMQGAGGVGGLLATVIHTGANAGTYFPAFDGNWNVSKYINASNGLVVAEYEYGPFHELIRASGPMAKDFNFLAATKYYDWETCLYYYGHRYYNPSIGRWLSRDPIEEKGGVILYGFVNNNPSLFFDKNGLDPVPNSPNGTNAIPSTAQANKPINCGMYCFRTIYPNAIPVPIIREISESACSILTPHAFLTTKKSHRDIADGETFSYPWGRDDDPKHWTVRCPWVIVIYPPKTCDAFWTCIRSKDWKDKQGKYRWSSNNCQDFSKHAVRDCGGMLMDYAMWGYYYSDK